MNKHCQVFLETLPKVDMKLHEAGRDHCHALIHPEQWLKFSDEERTAIQEALRKRGCALEVPSLHELGSIAVLMGTTVDNPNFWDPATVYFVPENTNDPVLQFR